MDTDGRMLEVLSAVGTGLILLFSGLTFWYQFIRTPRSDVEMELIGRDAYSTDSGGLTGHLLNLQFSNRGDMDAIVESIDVSTELVHPETGEAFEPPKNGRFNTPMKTRSIGEDGKLATGTTDKVGVKFDVRGLDEFPPEFDVKAFCEASIRDNTRVYDCSASDSFRFNVEWRK